MGLRFFTVELAVYLLAPEIVLELYHFQRLNHSKQDFQSSYYLPKAIFVLHILTDHMACVYIVALSDLFKTYFPNITQKKDHWNSTLIFLGGTKIIPC